MAELVKGELSEGGVSEGQSQWGAELARGGVIEGGVGDGRSHWGSDCEGRGINRINHVSQTFSLGPHEKEGWETVGFVSTSPTLP